MSNGNNYLTWFSVFGLYEVLLENEKKNEQANRANNLPLGVHGIIIIIIIR